MVWSTVIKQHLRFSRVENSGGGDSEGVDYFGSVKTSQKGCFLATLKNDERVDNRVSYGSEYFPEILWLYTTHGHWV